MAKTKIPRMLLLFCALIVVAEVTQGSRTQSVLTRIQNAHRTSPSQNEFQFKGMKSSRRSMIGSVAPTCTYNECRGCKYKCRAEQVPVEGNDPINSPYHYKCVCHR